MSIQVSRYSPLLAVLALLSMLATVFDKPLVLGAFVGAVAVGTPIFMIPWVGYICTVASLPIEVLGNLGNILPFINVTIAKLFALLTLIAYTVHLLARRTRFVWSKELTLWCVYVLIGTLSLIGADEVSRGFKEIFVTVSTLVFFFLTINYCTDSKRVETVVYIVATISVITFLFAIIQRYLPSFGIHERVGWNLENDVSFGYEISRLDAGSHEIIHRSAGLSGHPNVMAATSGLILPLLVWMFHVAEDTKLRAAALIGGIICLAGAVASLSRSGMMVYIAVVPTLFLFRVIRPNINQLTIVLVIAIASIPFWPTGFIERVLSPGSWTSQGSETVRWRYKLWDAALQAIADNPINGVGIGNNRTIFDYFYYPWNDGLQTVHNAYLQITMETGLQGVLCWFVLFAFILKRCWDLIKHPDIPEKYKILAKCIAASVLGFMFVGLALDFNRIGFKTLWLQMALIVALHKVLLDNNKLKERGY